ncbi:Peptidase M23 [Flexistipes sinusarabici DSM 4947]|uniref:Peptidase M23 n=1 Tax=Flexistipes sinusarabici (strain ATCC 49648 / DSM 4947 / MAS 10) TaxID=717231 RepID=F8E7U7_FLESM|nr:peptidoglycan DD-metalloendopeptidase family protein [Flexistipes sinusarabici]AEI15015.1 Peptidase M23 [Flexistipes sinusarabici DSM 4947]
MSKAVSVLLFAIIPLLSAAVSINDITSANKYLEKLKNEINREEKELKTIKNTREKILKQVRHIEKKISYNEEVLEKLDERMSKLKKNKQKLTHEIRETNKKIHRLKSRLKRSNIYIIDNKGYTKLKLLMFSQTYHNTIKNMEILEIINNKLLDEIKELKKATQKIEDLKAKYDTAESNLKNIYAMKKNVSDELVNQKIKYKQTLALLKEDKKSKEEYIEILNEKRNALQKKIEELEKSENKSDSISESVFAKAKGTLPWPAEGKVIEEFGPKKIEGFRGKVFNKGIKIALESEGVKSVFDGTVKYVDWIRGYGNIIIVKHDKNYYTLYANLDKIYVSTGQEVLRGEQIGSININSGNKKSTLYFEVRKQNEAVNPSLWLK